ncbi:MAG TPA: hypothetical protein ENN45_00070 [Bacteroidetes bacterium]|nr:hypothetical protein [Bacteroidota bacterium]
MKIKNPNQTRTAIIKNASNDITKNAVREKEITHTAKPKAKERAKIRVNAKRFRASRKKVLRNTKPIGKAVV